MADYENKAALVAQLNVLVAQLNILVKQLNTLAGEPEQLIVPPSRRRQEPYVLVATPARPETKEVFTIRSEVLYGRLTYPRRERAFVNDAVASVPGLKCGRHAAARNLLLEQYLRPCHTHVLWMDVDLMKVPNDLIENLLDVTATDIVAPHIYVEKVRQDKGPSFENGGWFYDTGAFIKDGRSRDMWKPELPGLQQMDSVGCCYMVPAEIYRKGCRYSPVGDEIEHLSFCRQAREMGYKVWATEDVQVEHAYLPKYGETWH